MSAARRTTRPIDRPRLIPAVAVGLATILTAVGLVAVAAPASATAGLTGEVGGTVSLRTEDGGSAPAEASAVLITAYRLDESGETPAAEVEAQEESGAGGAFSFGELPVGKYAFLFDYRGADPNRADGFTTGPYSIEEALSSPDGYFFEIGEEQVYPFDYTIEYGGIVNGTITRDGTSTPLANQGVELYRFAPGPSGSYEWAVFDTDRTDASGDYDFASLPQGSYTVRFGDGTGNYVPEFWENRQFGGADSADTFWVGTTSSGDGTPDVFTLDAALASGGKITGTVRNSSGTLLGGIDVTLYGWDSAWGSWREVGQATTSSKGTYALQGAAAGSYRVGFSGSSAGVGYLERFYATASNVNSATSISVATGATKSGVDITLIKGATITGTVSLAGGGHPSASDVQISACSTIIPCWDLDAEVAYSAATGAYAVRGLPASTYTLRFQYTGAGNFRSESYPDVHDGDSAQPGTIKLAAGATATGRNAVLDTGGMIAGHVGAAGADVAGVEVRAYLAGGTAGNFDEAVRSTVTDDDGDYVLTGLDPRLYTVRAEANSTLGYAWRFAGGSYSPAAADRIPVTIGATTSASDIELETGATLTVTVESAGADPQPVPSVDTDLLRYRTTGGNQFDWVPGWHYTDSDGVVEFTNLAPGEYTLRGWASGYLTGWYGDGASSPRTAERIVVAPGAAVSVTHHLDAYGTYTGRVVDEAGDPVVDARVGLYSGSISSTTDENGEFSLANVDEGANDIFVGRPVGDHTLVEQTRFPAPAMALNSAPVDVGEITIAEGATITGKVIGIDGRALPNTLVDAYAPGADGELWGTGYATTSSTGAFKIDGLPVGAAYLWLSPSKAAYVEQWAGGAPAWSLSEAVALTEPGANVYREIRMITGSTVTGTVTNKATGRALQGIGVSTRPNDALFFQVYPSAWDETSATGAYALTGLDAGSYHVWFNALGSGGSTPYRDAYADVNVPARSTVKLDKAMTPNTKVTGTVRASGGPGIANAVVEARTAGSDEVVTVTTNASGAYTLYLPSGSWNLQARDPDGSYATGYLGGGSPAPLVVATTALAGKNITLTRAGGGSVVAEFTSATEPDPQGHLVLERLDGADRVVGATEYPRGASIWNGNTGLDLLSPIEHVLPGTYQLRVQGVISDGYDPTGTYPEIVLGPFEVQEGAEVDLGTTDLGTAVDAGWRSEVVAGSEPVASSDGSPQVGEFVSVTDGVWAPAATEFSYQWFRDGKPIRGADAATYQLAPGDAGAVISVGVTPSSNGAFVYATVPGTVAKDAAPVPTTLPSVTGSARAGQSLKVAAGVWDVPGLSFTYAWTREGTPIAKATASSYKLTTGDVGTAIEVQVTATRPGFEPTTLTLAAPPILPATALKQTTVGKVTARVDGYSVTPGVWSPTGATFSYEWYEWDAATGVAALVGTGSTLTDAGIRADTTRLTVRITASRAGYSSTTIEQTARSGPKPTLTGSPVAGAPQVGVPVQLDWAGTTVAPATAAASYQWRRNGVTITGATSATYTPTLADATTALSVGITLKATGYTAWTSTDRVVVAVGTVAPAATLVAGTVSIVDGGRPFVGRKLAVDLGTWSPKPSSFGFVWKRDGVAIAKATASTYVLTAADAARSITVTVTGKFGSQTVAVTTPGVVTGTSGPVNLTQPALPAVVRVGVAVKADVGTWDLAPGSYAYQWAINGEPILGATASSFTPRVADVGDELTVAITAKRTGYPASVAVVSHPVTVLEGSALKATAGPVLTVGGKTVTSVARGKTVAATAGTWPVAALQLTYRWQVNTGTGWDDILGAEAPTLLIDPAAFTSGWQVRVVVSATRAGYLDGPDAVSAALKIGG